MSFYICKITSLAKRNADLIVINKEEKYSSIFSNTFNIYDSEFVKLSKEEKRNKHKNLLLVNNDFDIENIFLFANEKKCNSIEILLDRNIEKEKFERLLETISSYLLENELSIGLLVNSGTFIRENVESLLRNGVYIPKEKFERDEEDILEFETALQELFETRPIKVERRVEQNVEEEPGSINGGVEYGLPKQKRKVVCKNALPIIDEESFRDKLFRYINKSNKTSVEIYTKGGISKQVFSKAISSDISIPKKETIISLVIGLELDIDDALDLLGAAGYTLSRSLKFDKIVRTFITIKKYDLDEINSELNDNNLPLLGWKPREN